MSTVTWANRRPKGTATDGVSAEMLGLFDRYLKERVDRRTMMETTAHNERGSLYQFGRIHGDRPVAEIDWSTAERFLNEVATVSAASVRRRMTSAQGFCKWLVRNRMLSEDPFCDVVRPRVPRYVPRALTTDQVRAVFGACANDRNETIVSLMVNEALRCIEVSRLQFGDIDLNERRMRITGKGLNERVLPITDETWSCLTAYLGTVEKPGGPLMRKFQFPDRGLPARAISALISHLMRVAGIKGDGYDRISAHALRHTAATDMLRRGAHVRDVQRVLGHSNLSSTQRYLPLVVDDLRTVMGGRFYRRPPSELIIATSWGGLRGGALTPDR